MNRDLFKILSFFGAAIAVFLGFVTIASGVKLITLSHAFNGAITIVSGCVDMGVAVLIYKNFEKKDAEGKPGVKISDLKK